MIVFDPIIKREVVSVRIMQTHPCVQLNHLKHEKYNMVLLMFHGCSRAGCGEGGRRARGGAAGCVCEMIEFIIE